MNLQKPPLLSKKLKKAFTLIELLVVIAIIAILAAILFPVFGKARENARRSSCQSNLKQIGLAFMQYTQDYDERYPPGPWAYVNSNGVTSAWDVLVQPYLKSTQVLACPSDSKSNVVDVAGLGTKIRRSYQMSRYMWEWYNGATYNDQRGGRGVLMSALPWASTTIMLGEGYSFPPNGGFNYGDGSWCDSTYWYSTNEGKSFWDSSANAVGLHMNTVNILYADGHVKAKPMTKKDGKMTGHSVFENNASSPGYGHTYLWDSASWPTGG